MRIHQYDCEHCDFVTDNFDEMLKHEAKHLNITVKEYKTWYELYKTYCNAVKNVRPGCHIDIELTYHNAAAELDEFMENRNLKIPKHFEIFAME